MEFEWVFTSLREIDSQLPRRVQENKKTYGQSFGHHQEPIIANLP